MPKPNYFSTTVRETLRFLLSDALLPHALLSHVLLVFVTLLCSVATSQTFAQNSGDNSIVSQVLGGGIVTGPFTGNSINTFLGADRFYNAGLTGGATVVANIEAGYVWSGHESLTHVQKIPTTGSILGEEDRHATWVGSLLGGRPTAGNSPGNYQSGIVPDADFYSGAIANSWNGSRFTGGFNANFSGSQTLNVFRKASQSGLVGTRTADVINSSFNILGDPSGSGGLAMGIDGFASQNSHTLFVASVGNSVPAGSGPNKTASPATAYNNISVGSVQHAADGYDTIAFFTNGGPNDYKHPGFTASAARSVVDIAAPGVLLTAAYYGGETGGNGPSLGGSPGGPAGSANAYQHSRAGTSFSAPLVAGGAALLYDAAYSMMPSNSDARDARVVKAVLMNSADKVLLWDNGQTAHSNGNGGVQTSQGLDASVGTGRMNLYNAFDQMLSGTRDVAGTSHGTQGAVEALGWDFGEVSEGTTNDYTISGTLAAGSTFTSTLTWFRDRAISNSNILQDLSYDNLDLELWSFDGTSAVELISESNSLYNNSEHFSFLLPETGQYMIRVRWKNELFDNVNDINQSAYGLAWSTTEVPEPTTLVLLLCAALMSRGLIKAHAKT